MLFLYWGRKGGAARYSLEISKALAERKDVNVFLSVSNQCEIFDEFEALEVPVLQLDTYTTIPGYFYRLSFGRNGVRRMLQNFLRKNKIDVLIIGMDFFWGPVIYRACKREGVKSILVVHEPKPHPNEPFLMAQLKKWGLNHSIRGADHLVSLTEHVKRYIVDRYGIANEAIMVIPHGIFSYFKATKPKQLPVEGNIKILYFGRIANYKGLDILLRAFELLQEKHTSIQLEIWGSGNISQYEHLIEDLENVRIENRWIDESEITHVFKSIHICVLPYRDASQSGIVGIASEAAIPIVACPAEGLKEQLEGAGAVFSDDFTPQSLARSIEKLLLDTQLYTALSAKSLQYAENISWSSIASEFKKLGEDLLQNH